MLCLDASLCPFQKISLQATVTKLLDHVSTVTRYVSGVNSRLSQAPLVDQLSIPVLTSALGRRRSWMLLAQFGVAGSLLGMASLGPTDNLALFALHSIPLQIHLPLVLCLFFCKNLNLRVSFLFLLNKLLDLHN